MISSLKRGTRRTQLLKNFKSQIPFQSITENRHQYESLLESGSPPDLSTYHLLLQNTLTDSHRFNLSITYLEDMEFLRLQPDSETFRLLFRASAPISNVSNFRFFHRILYKIDAVDLIVLDGILHSLVGFRNYQSVFELIERYDLISADINLVTRVLDQCSSQGCEICDFIVDEFYFTMKRQVAVIHSELINVMIKCLVKSTNMVRKVEILEEFESIKYNFGANLGELELMSKTGYDLFDGYIESLMNKNLQR